MTRDDISDDSSRRGFAPSLGFDTIAAMELEIGPRYDPLRQEVRDFLADQGEHALPAAVGARADRDAGTRWQRTLVEHGYVGRTIPRNYGGFGAAEDPLETLVIEQELSRARVSTGMQNQGIGMLVPTLLHYGSEEQKQRWIGPTIRGETIWCQGYSEPESGSDLASLRTRARRDGDDYVINGQKIWTSSARESDMMFALVRTEPDAKKHSGISYLLLEVKTPGIDVRPLMTMTGDATFNEVFFTDARVPVTNLVGAPGQGWEIGTYLLRHERDMLGRPQQSETMLASCVEVLRDTGKIADPLFRDRLISLQARVLAMKYHGLRLLTDRLKERDSGLSRLVVKLNGCQLNYDICALAIDALGERGVLRRGSPRVRDGGAWQIQYMYSLGLIIGGGTAQIQKNIIGEVGLGLPREPKSATG